MLQLKSGDTLPLPAEALGGAEVSLSPASAGLSAKTTAPHKKATAKKEKSFMPIYCAHMHGACLRLKKIKIIHALFLQ
jgi:hypothetical protein